MNFRHIAIPSNPDDIDPLVGFSEMEMSLYSPLIIDQWFDLIKNLEIPSDPMALLRITNTKWADFSDADQRSLIADWTTYFRCKLSEMRVVDEATVTVYDMGWLNCIPSTTATAPLFDHIRENIREIANGFKYEHPLKELKKGRFPNEFSTDFSREITMLVIGKCLEKIEQKIIDTDCCVPQLVSNLEGYLTSLPVQHPAFAQTHATWSKITSSDMYKIARYVQKVGPSTPNLYPAMTQQLLIQIQKHQEEFVTIGFPKAMLKKVAEIVDNDSLRTSTFKSLGVSSIDSVGRKFMAYELKVGDKDRYLVAVYQNESERLIKFPPADEIKLPTTHKTADYIAHAQRCFLREGFLDACSDLEDVLGSTTEFDIPAYLEKHFPDADALVGLIENSDLAPAESPSSEPQVKLPLAVQIFNERQTSKDVEIDVVLTAVYKDFSPNVPTEVELKRSILDKTLKQLLWPSIPETYKEIRFDSKQNRVVNNTLADLRKSFKGLSAILATQGHGGALIDQFQAQILRYKKIPNLDFDSLHPLFLGFVSPSDLPKYVSKVSDPDTPRRSKFRSKKSSQQAVQKVVKTDSKRVARNFFNVWQIVGSLLAIGMAYMVLHLFRSGTKRDIAGADSDLSNSVFLKREPGVNGHFFTIDVVNHEQWNLDEHTDALSAALNLGHTETIRNYVHNFPKTGISRDELLTFLSAKNHNGNMGLFSAFYHNHFDAVEAFGELVNQCDLDEPDIIQLLSAKSNGVSVLCFFCQSGNTDGVLAYGKLINTFNLSEDGRLQLLSATGDGGQTGLYTAIGFGHAETARAFGSIVKQSNITSAKLIPLLISNNRQNVSTLYAALGSGRMGDISAYGDILQLFDLQEDDLVSILEAKHPLGLAGFLIPMHHNSVNTMIEYGDLIRRFTTLSDENVWKLLAPRDLSGPPKFLLQAVVSNYVDVISTYAKILGQFDISAKRVYSLLSRQFPTDDNQEIGVFGAAVSLQNSNVLDALGDIMSCCKFKTKDLISLLEARQKNGLPALSFVLQLNRPLAIPAYGRLLQRSGLSQEKILQLVSPENLGIIDPRSELSSESYSAYKKLLNDLGKVPVS